MRERMRERMHERMRSRCARGALAMGTLALALHAPAALAQGRTAEAQARFNEGVKAYARRDFEHARLAFLQSLALVERGSVLRNLGLAEMELGRPVDALHHLRAAIKLPDLDAEHRAVTDHDIRDAYAATGHISVQTSDGATLTVDGEAVEGSAPFPVPVDVMPGHHVLQAILADQTARAGVDAPAGVAVVTNLAIAPAPLPPLDTSPPAAVGEPPAAPARSSFRFEERPFWTVRREIGLGAVVVGLASTALGVYFYTQAIDAENRGNDLRTGLGPSSCVGPAPASTCGALNDARSTQSTDVTLNYLFVGIGAASLVAGGAMLVWPSSRASVAIAPVVTPLGGGLHVRGEF
jgi:hypothetical protein